MPKQDLDWAEREYKGALKSRYRLLPRVEEVLAREQAAHQAERDTSHIHPSEIASETWCQRATMYRIMGYEESDPEYSSFRLLNVFTEGTSSGKKWQRWMWQAGILIGMWECQQCDHKWWDKSPASCVACSSEWIEYIEVPLHDPDHLIIGHADGLCEDERGEFVVENKTVGLGTIRYDAPNLYTIYANGSISLDELWKRIKRPLTAHNKQVQLYMHCTGVHEGIVIYEWKPTQEIREFSVKFEPAVVAPLLKKCDEVIEALDQERLLPKPAEATSKNCKLCTYCPYKTECWGKK